MAKYASAVELPTFDQFIAAFQTRFTRADDARHLWLTIESMDQGTRSVLEYHTEFETVLSQIGEDTDMEWARMHFERGLHRGIRRHVALNAPSNATLDELATLGQRAYDVNQQLAKESTRSQTCPANSTPGPPATASSSHPETFRRTMSTPLPPRSDRLGFLTTRTSHGPFPKLTSEEDHTMLRKAGICFKYRQPGHISTGCPDRSKEYATMPVIKVESIEQPVIVESDQEFSPYKPVPTIRIPVKVAEARTPALIDTSASVNTMSPRVANRTNLPRL